MSLAIRLVRALWVFGLIFLSYMSQLALTSLLGEDVRDTNGRETRRVPAWLHERRKRLDAKNAKRLYEGMVRLRGVFIKLGQVLSITGGFLPRVYTKELERLQDKVPPRDFQEIRSAFVESLGRTPEECFARIDAAPLAAASLGQVHVAWMKPGEGETEGRKVAVKVLYPGIRDVIRIDMKVIWLAVQVYKQFVPVVGLDRVHASLLDLLARETDYLHEARAMERMAANFAREKDILFPEVVHELTTRDVLTMSFMDGIKINQVDALRAEGIDPSAVATRFVEATYKMIFVDRFFHADPHPGNFLVQKGRTPRRPKIVVLDFGAVSDVKDDLVDGMIDVIGGLLEGDGPKLLKGFYQMGFASREANHELLAKTVYTYFEKLLRVKQRTPGALMRANVKELETLVDPEVAREELRELMRSVEYPEGWFYVERAAVLAFWLVGQLDPDVDAMQVGYPYVMPLLEKRRREEQGGEREPSEPPPSDE
ncbi:ABC1 kinase family protein [Sandaracinus amylolyticus]|uniref:ABC1 kinase family protein n=1 Tax=Sandaracinus amylolyticus TaxID=927083 RepID=UPI001F1FDD82|nr:AarF/UbiB family protein [Sandaracinus amylolyticus]UJR79982.1 Ubiquinone biosynthesis monooxygenase UbiB [Sandaracinus amylolyticus]